MTVDPGLRPAAHPGGVIVDAEDVRGFSGDTGVSRPVELGQQPQLCRSGPGQSRRGGVAVPAQTFSGSCARDVLRSRDITLHTDSGVVIVAQSDLASNHSVDVHDRSGLCSLGLDGASCDAAPPHSGLANGEVLAGSPVSVSKVDSRCDSDGDNSSDHIAADDADRLNRPRLRRLTDWFGWARRFGSRLTIARHAWKCSTAFSGIGCAELAARSLEQVDGIGSFHFSHALERDATARSVLNSHSRHIRCQHDILSWLPAGVSRGELIAAGFDELRATVLADSFKLNGDVVGPGVSS